MFFFFIIRHNTYPFELAAKEASARIRIQKGHCPYEKRPVHPLCNKLFSQAALKVIKKRAAFFIFTHKKIRNTNLNAQNFTRKIDPTFKLRIKGILKL